jgi:hypothetical protein
MISTWSIRIIITLIQKGMRVAGMRVGLVIVDFAVIGELLAECNMSLEVRFSTIGLISASEYR